MLSQILSHYFYARKWHHGPVYTTSKVLVHLNGKLIAQSFIIIKQCIGVTLQVARHIFFLTCYSLI